ncbi:hypothetical protein E3O45_02395 [Cryobacterium sp. TMS1-20-1]|uniref:hypothetical protein n=1 Tax=Cryobacterium sp. TMS1-20-1 TaxID=1259223 RepID=UPI001069FE98|nr:hypothetical protein [Cryobacterium sp. TMS1-20-1]TFC80344.1 hypothetical protein E3O45_02395 [Cryobacterium sp. TMS1-20-1]
MHNLTLVAEQHGLIPAGASNMLKDSSSPSSPNDSPPNAANNASRACSTATITGFKLDSHGLSMNMGAIASFP